MPDSLNSLATLRVGDQVYSYFSLPAVAQTYPQAARLPFALKILLENLLRHEDGLTVRPEDIPALATWQPQGEPSREIAFRPARVLLQDFTGVPAVVDLAAMRDAMRNLGGDPQRINPLLPVQLVIDHSVQVDAFGSPAALQINADLEFTRNRERYSFLRWGQAAFQNFTVIPPDTGIVHQVNLEYLARVVLTTPGGEKGDSPHSSGGLSPFFSAPLAYPDTLVGTDSHTTMINGLGILGWGVGGIEAEAAMLGQPVALLIPKVVGVRLVGQLPEGSTATDLVLTVTEILRRKGVVGQFVEFFGEGLANLPVADRATIANMSPEYGATCGLFPVDAETLRYLRFSGRPKTLVRLVEAYSKEQGLFHTPQTPEALYSDVLELDLTKIELSLAGPRRPQDRIPLSGVKKSWSDYLLNFIDEAEETANSTASPAVPGVKPERGLQHGSVVIAAITSCTNTSNPSVMMAAGLLARKAVQRGLQTPTWVKTSLAPGSKVVTDYLKAAGLLPYLEKLRFHLVGYGCTTCIGNSGPLPPVVTQALEENGLVVASVLSGNRNFEGRIHAEVKANFLASPPLVVAYALAGRIDIDWSLEPLGTDSAGQPVFLRDLWPTQQEVRQAIDRCVRSELFRKEYGQAQEGDEHWRALEVPQGNLFAWDPTSTFVKHPPYFVNMAPEPAPVQDIRGARVLALLGDSITTDHISPAGSIKALSPAGRYLIEHGVAPADFNSYGSRRGNHEVMVRGTFANIRLKNLLAPGTEGGVTRHLPDGALMSIYDASMLYQSEGVPLLVIAGKEYGSGSSRDWAAKGPKLLGVRVVLAESYERIHRSNLVGMGILPLQFQPGASAADLGLTGEEIYDIEGLADVASGMNKPIMVKARRTNGTRLSIPVVVRIDTPQEEQYYRHGGILPYVLRQLLQKEGGGNPE
jgi:aconitate hydratase